MSEEQKTSGLKWLQKTASIKEKNESEETAAQLRAKNNAKI